MEIDRCQDLRGHFCAFVTDSIDATVEARIREHLSMGCASCAQEIGRLDAAFYTLPRAQPPVPFLEGGAEAMVAAIIRRPQEQPETPILFPEGRPLRVAWTVAFFFALALVAAAVWGRGQGETVENALLKAASESRQTRRVVDDYRSLQSSHAAARALLDQLSDAETLVVEMRGEAGTARAFVSLEAKSVLFTTSGLAEDPAYRLRMMRGDSGTVLGPLEPKIADGGGGRQYDLPESSSWPAVLELINAADRVVLSGTVIGPAPSP
jgi:hypothetical protein